MPKAFVLQAEHNQGSASSRIASGQGGAHSFLVLEKHASSGGSEQHRRLFPAVWYPGAVSVFSS